MREIKFRAWNERRWLSDNEWGLTPDGAIMVYEAQDDEWVIMNKTCPPYRIIISQYTGLLDKNGKEIYEGDILKSTSELMSNFGKDPTGKYRTEYNAIEYDTSCARYRERRLADNWLQPIGFSQGIVAKYSEVIGNIYENPELLR